MRLRNESGVIVNVADDYAAQLLEQGWEALDAPAPAKAAPKRGRPKKTE